MCSYDHACVRVTFCVSKYELKVERLILWSQTALGRTLGCISTPPPHSTSNQPNSGVINNTPSITLCTQMGRQVEGWWRTARCVVLHPIIQIRVWTSDSAPPPPLPCCIARFVSFRYPSTAANAICHCRALLKTPFKKRAEGALHSDSEWFMKCWCVLTVLCLYSVLLEEYQCLQSCQSKAQRTEVSHICSRVLYISAFTLAWAIFI